MTTANKNTNSTNFKLFVLFVLLVLSSTGAFAQANTVNVTSVSSTQVSVSKDATMTITTDNSVAAGMDFAVWFTGVKKTSDTSSNNGTFTKKQLINSGIKTNSVLIRSFLKKINTQENGVV